MIFIKSNSDFSINSEYSMSIEGVRPDFSKILDALAKVYWMYGAVSPSS